MSGEFVDYKKAPGFWFYLQILLAVDITENPLLSAKHSDFMPINYDLFEIFDQGMWAYRIIYEKQLRGY